MIKGDRVFKRLQMPVTAYVVEVDSALFEGLKVRKNGLIIWDQGRMVYCDRFPNASYKGKNPWLEVWEYDFDFQVWDYVGPEKSTWTRTMWDIYKSGGYKKIGTIYNYADLMKHDRKHKHGSGQKDSPYAITDYDCIGCPAMRGGHVEGYYINMPYGGHNPHAGMM